MTSDHWRKSYGDLIDRLPAYVSNARTAICGLATCVDAYVRLDEAQALLNAETATPQAALAKELFRRAAAGIGGEFRLNWPAGGTWVEKNLRISSWGLGGNRGSSSATASRSKSRSPARRVLPDTWRDARSGAMLRRLTTLRQKMARSPTQSRALLS